jgi:hypothetical protein
MKIVSSALLVFFITSCFGQNELESKFGLRKDILTDNHKGFLNSFENLEENDIFFNKIISTIESDSIEHVVKVILLEKYLDSRLLYNTNYVSWLLANIGFEIDKNVYDFKSGMQKNKYPILYFLISQENENLFDVEDLMSSTFMADCEFFDDSYNKYFTCKLLAEFILSTEGLQNELYETMKIDICAKKNYKRILNFCSK